MKIGPVDTEIFVVDLKKNNKLLASLLSGLHNTYWSLVVISLCIEWWLVQIFKVTIYLS